MDINPYNLDLDITNVINRLKMQCAHMMDVSDNHLTPTFVKALAEGLDVSFAEQVEVINSSAYKAMAESELETYKAKRATAKVKAGDQIEATRRDMCTISHKPFTLMGSVCTYFKLDRPMDKDVLYMTKFEDIKKWHAQHYKSKVAEIDAGRKAKAEKKRKAAGVPPEAGSGPKKQK